MNELQTNYAVALAEFRARLSLYHEQLDKVPEPNPYATNFDAALEAYEAQAEALQTRFGLGPARQALRKAENDLLSWGKRVCLASPLAADMFRRSGLDAEDIERLFGSVRLDIRDRLCDLTMRLDADIV